MTIHIRDLFAFEEFLQVQNLHRTIWGLREGIYPPVLNTAAHNGGVVLGAFDGDTLIGFSFAFLGRHSDGTLKLCSQTTGLLPAYRGMGIGERLKWAQYDRAVAADLRLITWTTDPLEAPNAILNLRKLGTLSRTYYVNLYGEHFSALGEGLPSDRLLIEWWLDRGHVIRLRRGDATMPLALTGPVANPTSGTGLSRQITVLELELDAPTLLIEIPSDIQAMRKANLPLARDWRIQTRACFQTYLERGYIAQDAYTTWEQGERRVFYVLKKG